MQGEKYTAGECLQDIAKYNQIEASDNISDLLYKDRTTEILESLNV